MSALKSLLGITGNADASRRAGMIAELAHESVTENRKLNEQLKEYTRADDPFTAMVIDLHNRRTAVKMARQGD